VRYGSFSNGATRAELAAKTKPGKPEIDTGGAYGRDFYKYRVVIFCTYSREQLPALLDYLFKELHQAGVMLADVKEQHTWSQPWYFPRVPDAHRRQLFTFKSHTGNKELDVDGIYSVWKAEQDKLKAASIQRATALMVQGKTALQACNEAFTIQQLAVSYGFVKSGKKYISPHSESGHAQFLINGKRWTSFHGSDAEVGLGNAGKNGERFGDAFDLFCFFEHGNDRNAALKAAGDMFRTSDGKTVNEKQQKEWRAAQEPKSPVDIDVDAIIRNRKKFSMKNFSLNGQSQDMKKRMLADRYVLDRIAILGQATTIYAKPNTGKTLLVIWMIIESIKAGRITGENVFYINADDDYKGLVYKVGLAEKYGFQMLAPSHNGFDSASLQGYMQQLISNGTARNTVMILDTLKKFTDLMDKKKG